MILDGYQLYPPVTMLIKALNGNDTILKSQIVVFPLWAFCFPKCSRTIHAPLQHIRHPPFTLPQSAKFCLGFKVSLQNFELKSQKTIEWNLVKNGICNRIFSLLFLGVSLVWFFAKRKKGLTDISSGKHYFLNDWSASFLFVGYINSQKATLKIKSAKNQALWDFY